jgi:oxygen-independent coproporphyrinogen-3 oxidase
MFHPIYDQITNEKRNFFQDSLKVKRLTPNSAEVYIHIPFCDSFCHMCACYKTHTPKDVREMKDYVEKLKREIAYYAGSEYVQSLDIQCVHIGGGTPSALTSALLYDLLTFVRDSFSLKPDTEITVEGEVCSLKNKEKINSLRKAGCNRISFGIQTFNPLSRKLSGLISTREEIKECIKNLRGFEYQINFDLMFGLPGQSFKVWEEDLAQALDMGADGLDVYELVLYPTTKLFQFRHKVSLVDDDERLDMLEYAIKYLNQNGFEQKSNAVFEKPNNMWNKISIYYNAPSYPDCIAIGDNAIGCINNFAYRNHSPIDMYMAWDESPNLPIRLGLKLDEEDQLAKRIWILPKLLKIKKKNVEDVMSHYQEPLNLLFQKGLIREDEEHISLTDLGLLWTDNIFMEFTPQKQKNRMWKIMY